MAQPVRPDARRFLTLLLAGACVAAPGVSHAQVIEIAGDGSIGVAAPVSEVVDDVGARAASATVAAEDDLSGGDGPDVPAAALTAITPSEVPAPYRAALDDAAARARISPDLLAALVWQESRWKADAVSSKGARGLAQLMPATATALAVDPRDPVANLDGGAAYLRRMLDLFDGDVERALAAYNAGPARVIRAGGVPPIAETRAYVSTILDRLGRSNAAQAGVTPR